MKNKTATNQSTNGNIDALIEFIMQPRNRKKKKAASQVSTLMKTIKKQICSKLDSYQLGGCNSFFEDDEDVDVHLDFYCRFTFGNIPDDEINTYFCVNFERGQENPSAVLTIYLEKRFGVGGVPTILSRLLSKRLNGALVRLDREPVDILLETFPLSTIDLSIVSDRILEAATIVRDFMQP